MSITSIENLSNECFYEIFEYLDGYHIFQAFSNLNYHFQQLLHSSFLLLKIDPKYSSLYKSYLDIYEQILHNNKHQILSFHLCSSLQRTDFFSSFSFDSSFNRLEALVIDNAPSTVFLSLLNSLSSLPRLFSLTIDMRWSSNDLNEVYRLIFALPKLKYIKCSTDHSSGSTVALPMATEDQSSTIKYFVTDYDCNLAELCHFMSYTPQLCHLSLSNLSDGDLDNDIILPISFPHLTYLSIGTADITFENLQMFIIETECNLKVLRMTIFSEDKEYLDGDQWENLIENYLPQLEEFYVQYYQTIDPESGSLEDFQPSDQFNSIFWNERKLVLEVQIDSSDIVYTIESYKERWYDAGCSNDVSNSTRLIIRTLSYDDYLMELDLIIRDLLAIAQIYHLEIWQKSLHPSLLIDLICQLPALQTLKLSSLNSSNEDRNRRVALKKSVISKVYIEKIETMEDIDTLLRLCPRMKYLKVDSINNLDIVLFVQTILKQTTAKSLRSLCIHFPTADDKVIGKLKEVFNYKKRAGQFSIEYVHDHIYLQWK